MPAVEAFHLHEPQRPVRCEVLPYFKIPAEQILVAHDELDLPAGAVRLKQGGGHAGHNGLRDIMSALGTGTSTACGSASITRRTAAGRGLCFKPPLPEDAVAIAGVLDEAAKALPEILIG